MKNLNRYLILALTLGFFLISFNIFLSSKPDSKNKRIYKIVKNYSPYYIEKRFGGLKILSKEDSNFKLEPNNRIFFKELKNLERKWAKKHLEIKNNKLLILDNNKTILKRVELKNKDEINFINNYYGVK